jgi:hypothetical protein
VLSSWASGGSKTLSFVSYRTLRLGKLKNLFIFSVQVVRPPRRHDVLPSNFVEGSYVTPVTFKCGDLYARGWLIDWWRHMCPTRSVDDLVEFLARDYCDEFRTLPDSYFRIVRDS